jgi:hypothetical protein
MVCAFECNLRTLCGLRKASGFGFGVVGYEWNVAKYFGMELDLAYQHETFHLETTFGYNNDPNQPPQSATVNESVSISAVRLPLLAKLKVPVAVGNLWIGAGQNA